MPADRRAPFVLVVEDHPLIADSLVACIQAGRPGLRVEAVNSVRLALVRLTNRTAPLLILTDLTLVDAKGIDAVRDLRAAVPQSPLLVFTAIDDQALRDQARALGVVGYLLKSVSTETLRATIRHLIGEWSPRGNTAPPPSDNKEALARMLTKKQTEVLDELVAGRSNKEIASRLGISDQTVSSHMKDILSRLGVRNRTEAVSRYFQLLSQRPHRHRDTDNPA